jgi:hypothetical protein
MQRKGDWWCTTCKFTIWASKPQCYKCGMLRPEHSLKIEKKLMPIVIKQERDNWESFPEDPKWNTHGPYSSLKGGYYGKAISGEPEGMIYPACGCDHLSNCPKRHHQSNCTCYTCRYKSHKW